MTEDVHSIFEFRGVTLPGIVESFIMRQPYERERDDGIIRKIAGFIILFY